jgi:hypothetical protein
MNENKLNEMITFYENRLNGFGQKSVNYSSVLKRLKEARKEINEAFISEVSYRESAEKELKELRKNFEKLALDHIALKYGVRL